MECERLQKLIKGWYMQVQDESMAPARMVEFMRNHAEDCLTCMADPVIEGEISRITEMVLPPSKIPKAVRREEKKQNEVAEEAETDKSTEDESNDPDDEKEEEATEADETDSDEDDEI